MQKFRFLNLSVWLIVIVVLLYGIIYPNSTLLFSTSFTEFFSILFKHITLEAIATSLFLSLVSVVGSALVGVPLALFFEKYDFPARRFFAILATLPLALPPLVGAVAFIFLYGESGILQRIIQHTFGFSKPLWDLQGWTALILFHVYTMYPFFFTLTSAGLRRIDASLEEAAQSLGANRRQTLFRVTLPQLTPFLISAALIVFMTSMASFSAPYLFGGTIRVLTLEVFNARQRGDTSYAIVQTIILTIISLSALFVFYRYEGTKRFAAIGSKGVARRREKLTGILTKTLAFAAGLILALLLSAPVLTLILISFSVDNTWTTQTLPPKYTLENYAKFFTSGSFREPLFNSFLMAGIAAVCALIWSFLVVSVTEGKQNLSKRIVAFLNLVPYALPGTALAIAIIQSYGQSNWLSGSFILVGTFWILPVAYFLRFMPLVTRSLQAGTEQFDQSLEQAASTLGANSLTRFWRVRFPLVLPSALAGTLLALTIGLGEYVASILLYVPRNRPVSLAIASEMRSLNLGTAAAYGVVLMLVIIVCLILANSLEQRSAS